MAGKVEFIKKAKRKYETLPEVSGYVRAGRDVHPGNSKTMGCGVVEFKGIDLPWTVKYDEYFRCLTGSLTIRSGGKKYVMKPGDGIWLPRDTKLTYQAKAKTSLMFAIYPADWRGVEKRGGKPKVVSHRNKAIKLVRKGKRVFGRFWGPPGYCKIGRDVDVDISTTLGCGMSRFRNVKFPWTVHYDEYFYGLKGTLIIHVRGKKYPIKPGDGIWLPAGTPMIYEAGNTEAQVAYAILPVNWRQVEAKKKKKV